MSVKSMALVWDSDLPREEKYILLAYADHADHEGQNIYPSVGLVSWKTGYSERAVQLITRKLVELEILIFEKISNLGTNQYRIDFSNLPSRLPYSRKRGAKISPPNDNEGVQNLPQGVQKTAGGVKKSTKGV